MCFWRRKAKKNKKEAEVAAQVAVEQPTEEVVTEDGVDIEVVEDDQVDPVVEDAVVSEEVAEQEAATEEAAEENAQPNAPVKPRKKSYHIALREDGKWQVKLSKGGRALKLFRTQAEAIAFAKEKAKNQDGHIIIHKVDGKIRKQKYKY